MNTTPSCKPETLVIGSQSDVQYCFDCKMMHLNIGSITLRLSRHQFADFIADLNQANTNLRHRELKLGRPKHANVTKLHS
jgi:hypothetical protein